MPLSPDKKEVLNGLTVYDYDLTVHNPNKISMPTAKRKKTVAITIHNTEWINVASNTTPAEQYTRATQNGNMNSVRVHFYVDNVCAWRNLPEDLINWSCADGTSNPNSGNNTSIAIEVVGNSKEAEANAVKLAAYLLDKYGLTVEDGLRTHTYWLNVRDGKGGSIDYLNTARHPYKWCPVYILPHWSTFKENVKASYDAIKAAREPQSAPTPTPTPEPTKYYRIRKSWDDAKSQIGAFASLENAKKEWKEGYFIFDWNGKVVYPEPVVEKKRDVIYCTYVGSKWNSDIVNYNDKDSKGYSGVKGYPIRGLAVKVSEGTVTYRVHIKGGGWLSWISKFDKNNWKDGCAGLKSQQVDAIQVLLNGVEGYAIKYRVSPVGKDYYPWVIGLGNYAGVFGKPIDRIQMQIVKI